MLFVVRVCRSVFKLDKLPVAGARVDNGKAAAVTSAVVITLVFVVSSIVSIVSVVSSDCTALFFVVSVVFA